MNHANINLELVLDPDRRYEVSGYRSTMFLPEPFTSEQLNRLLALIGDSLRPYVGEES